jgi:hypothetical protein
MELLAYVNTALVLGVIIYLLVYKRNVSWEIGYESRRANMVFERIFSEIQKINTELCEIKERVASVHRTQMHDFGAMISVDVDLLRSEIGSVENSLSEKIAALDAELQDASDLVAAHQEAIDHLLIKSQD